MSVVRALLVGHGGGSTIRTVLDKYLDGHFGGKLEVVGIVAGKRGIGLLDKVKLPSPGGNIFPKERVFTLPTWGMAPEALSVGLVGVCRGTGANWLGMHGWTAMMPEAVIEYLIGQVMNQHPSVITPEEPVDAQELFCGWGFYGLTPHVALMEFARLCGRPITTQASVHTVSAKQYDKGRLLAARPLTVDINWSPEDEQEKLLPEEHKAVVEAYERIVACGGGIPEAVPSYFQLLPGEEELMKGCRTFALEQTGRIKPASCPIGTTTTSGYIVN